MKQKLLVTYFVFIISSCSTTEPLPQPTPPPRPAPPPTVPVNVYNLDNAQILKGYFVWTGAKGVAKINKSKGTTCSGEYFTVIGGNRTYGTSNSSTWGSIYAWGNTNSHTNISGDLSELNTTRTTIASQPNTQKGSAILVCTDKDVIQCEYIVNLNNHGSGYCRDKRNSKWKIIW